VGGDVVMERLVILDGDQSDNNIWYSDDCGITWDTTVWRKVKGR
jgi:hypothetical protein